MYISQNSQDLIFGIPMMLKDGTQATSLDVSSFTVNIVQPNGLSLTNFTSPTITNPTSKGQYILAFLTSANSKAFTETTSMNPYQVVLDHPETDVEPMPKEIWVKTSDFNALTSEVGSIFIKVNASATTTVVDVCKQVGIPRIEAGDTYQFTKDFVSVPNSVGFEIKNPEGTIVQAGTATQSGSTANYFFDYTTTTSFYTTPDSSGWHLAIWTAHRSTGDDLIRDKFEVIRTTV